MLFRSASFSNIFKLGPSSLVCIENKQISFCFWILETVSGITYSGRAADTWAVGVTLYYMILGQYPFLADTLQDTYDKVRVFASDQCFS